MRAPASLVCHAAPAEHVVWVSYVRPGSIAPEVERGANRFRLMQSPTIDNETPAPAAKQKADVRGAGEPLQTA
jgi:hypothetical protein